MATKVESQDRSKHPNSCALFSLYFKARNDIGFANMLLDLALQPRDPFKPWERRKFKKGFVATMLLPVVAVAWFIYFSLPR